MLVVALTTYSIGIAKFVTDLALFIRVALEYAIGNVCRIKLTTTFST